MSPGLVDLAPARKTLESEKVLLRMLEENAGQTVTLAQRQRHGWRGLGEEWKQQENLWLKQCKFCGAVLFCGAESGQVSLLVAPPPALTWRSAQNVAATLLALIGLHSHTASGSAFPDVCCSFDLLLPLKLHPPPRLARLLPQQQRVQGLRPHPPCDTLQPARPSTTITIQSSQPGSSLSFPHQNRPLPVANCSPSTDQPYHSSPTHHQAHAASHPPCLQPSPSIL
ncbi:hypothetical protein D5F01_LYC10565 [Larimichthys crocea]|uniref:Uncharacterized protein n=1 Tax=Larimichthys crocea TaxID=215358 RepID=A0A6G0II42_LARCR|nr:hypothetical protein D5F01_LYC10565 [Larimichthys crocea]